MRIFELFTGAFHSAATYREVRKAGDSLIGFALVIVASCMLSVTAYYGFILHREIFVAHGDSPALFDSVINQIATQTPLMTLKEGTLATQNPEATVIKISGSAFNQTFTDVALITIDTTGKSTHETMKTPMLITAKEFIYKSDKETKIQPLSELTKNGPSTILINRAVAEEMAKKLIDIAHNNLGKFYIIIGGITWFFLSIFAFIMRLFLLLALGLVGQLIGKLIRSPISYASALGLATLSYTPVALLDTALMLGFGYSPHLLTLLIAATVALFAAIKCSDESSAPTPSNA